MSKRTTIELDELLLARAKKALGAKTTRATVEEALRRVAEQAEAEHRVRRQAQLQYLRDFAKHADVDVLLSDEAWR